MRELIPASRCPNVNQVDVQRGIIVADLRYLNFR